MSPTERSGELRVGMVGYAFMGAAHSQAWRTVNHAFDLPLRVRMAALCGRDEEKVRAFFRGKLHHFPNSAGSAPAPTGGS